MFQVNLRCWPNNFFQKLHAYFPLTIKNKDGNGIRIDNENQTEVIFFLSGAGMEHKSLHTRVKYDALSYDLSDCVQVYIN